MSANTPESKPQPNDNPAIWTLVRDAAREVILDPKDAVLGGLLEDMLARDEMGRAKYGTPGRCTPETNGSAHSVTRSGRGWLCTRQNWPQCSCDCSESPLMTVASSTRSNAGMR
jgi:hypothetical protein